MDQSDAFHLEEYKALRREIEQGVEELRKSRRNALVAVFAVYAWLATGGLFGNAPEGSTATVEAVALAWWLPVLIPVFGFVEYLGIMRRILDAGSYIHRLEELFADHAVLGWEHNLANIRRKKPFQSQAQGWSGFVLWPLLFGITILIAIVS